ncbi:hypothetical protein DFJ74DRAFT_433214 [Hyaloraphidium curvatum]|nr:hypothetical protein DFJ74DRAFT_433214 [Hyaloraphidium curvatum]
MPLDVFTAGVHRTASTSIWVALLELGIPAIHSYSFTGTPPSAWPVVRATGFDVGLEDTGRPPGFNREKPWECPVFSDGLTTFEGTADGTKGAEDADAFLRKYFSDARAFCDCCYAFDALRLAYPNAKVILNVPPTSMDSWFDSLRSNFFPFDVPRACEDLRKMDGRFVFPMRMVSAWLGAFLGGRPFTRTKAIAAHNEHIARVRASVPPERLLVYSVAEGWPPLCAFLGVPVPDRPFPKVNDSDAMRSGPGMTATWLAAGLGIAVGEVLERYAWGHDVEA